MAYIEIPKEITTDKDKMAWALRLVEKLKFEHNAKGALVERFTATCDADGNMQTMNDADVDFVALGVDAGDLITLDKSTSDEEIGWVTGVSQHSLTVGKGFAKKGCFLSRAYEVTIKLKEFHSWVSNVCETGIQEALMYANEAKQAMYQDETWDSKIDAKAVLEAIEADRAK
jgi:hypothetical protein